MVGASACVPPLPIGTATPPCAGGYHPCVLENTCVRDGELCPTSMNCPMPPTSARVLELGASDFSNPTPNFSELDGAGTLGLFPGLQGGYHVFTNIKLLGVDPSRGVTVDYAIFDPADTGMKTALRQHSEQFPLYCAKNAFYLLVDPPLLYGCPSLVPGEAMHDRDLVMHLKVTDGAGNELTGNRTIHPVCAPGDTVCTNDSHQGCAAP